MKIVNAFFAQLINVYMMYMISINYIYPYENLLKKQMHL